MPAAVLLAGALAVAGCSTKNRNDPATWVPKLASTDARERREALQELRRLKARQAAPQVAQLLRDPLLREDAALALSELGTPAEVPALLEAVETAVGAGSDAAARAANRANRVIAQAIGEIATQGPVDARAGEALLRLARTKDDEVRLQAVQALGAVKDPKAVPELSRFVDDEATPPLVAKKAIVSLGQIGDPAAIPALEHGLVIERQGVSFFPEASFSLFLLGQPAADAMLKLLQDQDPQYLSWAKDRERSAAGTYAKAALVLGDLGDQRAVQPLLAKLKYTDPDVSPGTAQLLTNLVRQFAASALGRLRAKEAAAPIQALVSTRDPQDEETTTAASEALVFIGDRSQARELVRKAQTGPLKLRLIAAQAAALIGEPALGKELLQMALREEKGSQPACARSLGELGIPLDDPRQACALVATQFGELSAPLEAARVCAQDAPCWLTRLKDKDPAVRARAAYELGRAGAAGAAPQLLAALKDDEPLVRIAATRALEWLIPVPSARDALRAGAPRISAQLAEELGKPQLAKVDEELRRLQIKLSRL